MQFRKIRGLVLHEDSDRRLYHPVVSWVGDKGELIQVQFDSECEGIFEVWVPESLQNLMISNRLYQSSKLPLHPQIGEYIVRLNRHKSNEGLWDKPEDALTQ
ncbi:MAG: hypothetical protein HC913_13915 [Microscillaceae bacterium]|nr:hypothetical protein [Microscillaceae bacterium]